MTDEKLRERARALSASIRGDGRSHGGGAGVPAQLIHGLRLVDGVPWSRRLRRRPSQALGTFAQILASGSFSPRIDLGLNTTSPCACSAIEKVVPDNR